MSNSQAPPYKINHNTYPDSRGALADVLADMADTLTIIQKQLASQDYVINEQLIETMYGLACTQVVEQANYCAIQDALNDFENLLAFDNNPDIEPDVEVRKEQHIKRYFDKLHIAKQSRFAEAFATEYKPTYNAFFTLFEKQEATHNARKHNARKIA